MDLGSCVGLWKLKGMDLSGCLWLDSGFGYESQWFGYGGLVVTVVWIFWVCSCSLSPSRFWIFLLFWVCSCSPSPSRFWIFLLFWVFIFILVFSLFFFHLVKIYTKHQTQKSNPDFRNMGLNLIFWVLNLLGLCFVDLVLAVLNLLGLKFVVLVGFGFYFCF